MNEACSEWIDLLFKPSPSTVLRCKFTSPSLATWLWRSCKDLVWLRQCVLWEVCGCRCQFWRISNSFRCATRLIHKTTFDLSTVGFQNDVISFAYSPLRSYLFWHRLDSCTAVLLCWCCVSACGVFFTSGYVACRKTWTWSSFVEGRVDPFLSKVVCAEPVYDLRQLQRESAGSGFRWEDWLARCFHDMLSCTHPDIRILAMEATFGHSFIALLLPSVFRNLFFFRFVYQYFFKQIFAR